MLMSLNLVLGEWSVFDVGADAPQVLPDSASTLEANFADVLHQRAQLIPANMLVAGESLPDSGNALPASKPEQPIAPDGDPEAIVSSLNRRIAELLDPGTAVDGRGLSNTPPPAVTDSQLVLDPDRAPELRRDGPAQAAPVDKPALPPVVSSIRSP